MENRKLFDSNRLKRVLKRKRAPGNTTAKVLCQPGFPLYYMLRNLGWLRSEPWWASLSLRAKRVTAIRMLAQRGALFKEVKKWRQNNKSEQIETLDAADNPGVPDYCNKCGLCCEVASGMADFPFPERMPPGWKLLFADGLGRGHRFCPFLWEDNCSGGGLCSIYPLRSNPCRLFGVDECDFFWKSKEPLELSSRPKILKKTRWLIKHPNLRSAGTRP
ncbi:MAG: YkgJ family cysteine cluster protein [Syntrophobacteraceae bacterium]